MNGFLIKTYKDIAIAVGMISTKLKDIVKDKKNIITDKKLTKHVKNANTYIYTGAGYDTETTTIKHKEVCIYNKYYEYNPVKNVYYVKDKLNQIVEKEFNANEGKIFTRPDFAYVYHVQIMIAGVYIRIRHFEFVKDFIEQLSDKIKELTDCYVNDVTGYPKILVWVANLNFEWSFLKGILPKGYVTKYFAKNSTHPLQIVLNDVIELRECVGLWGYNLEKIADTYTKTKKLKGDLDYNLIRHEDTPLTDKELEYCYNDVKILDELSYIAHDTYTKKHMSIPFTQTGVVRQLCRKALGKSAKFVKERNFLLMPAHECEENDIEGIQKGKDLYFEWREYLYQGGYAHSNAKYVGKELKDVKCADITSDYPYQMNVHYYPAGELIHTKENEVEEIIKNPHKCYIMKVRLNNVESRTTHTLISRNKVLNLKDSERCIWDNGRLYRGSNIILWVNEVDMANIATMYTCDVEVLDMYHFTKRASTPKYILETMNQLYIKKNELKEKGLTDTIEYLECKAKVNSIYGMCGTRLYNMITDLDDNGNFKEDVNKNFNYYDEIKKLWLNPYIAYWTTAYARAIIVHYISMFPDLVVQYDTDSIYYITDTSIVEEEEVMLLEKELDEHNKRVRLNNSMIFVDRHMYDLGTWDIGNKLEKFKCLGAKRYIYQTYPDKEGNVKLKPVIAGCPKKAFIKYVKDNNVDAFKFFDNDMTLSGIDSFKNASFYSPDNYKPITINITDYLGVTRKVTYRTYCALYEIPFKLTLDKIWVSELEKIVDSDKKMPNEYRKYKDLENILYEKKRE